MMHPPGSLPGISSFAMRAGKAADDDPADDAVTVPSTRFPSFQLSFTRPFSAKGRNARSRDKCHR